MEDRLALSTLAALRVYLCRLFNLEPLDDLHPNNYHVSPGIAEQPIPGEPFHLHVLTRSLGFERTAANALAAVGASLSLAVVFIFAYISDRTNQRGLSVMGAHACYIVVLVVAKVLHPRVGKWSRWGLWTAVNSFAVGYHPAHNSWVQLNCRDAGERSISIA